MPLLSYRFHVRFIVLAPSAKPEILIPDTEEVGDVSCPDELNWSVPVATGVGVPVPPVSAEGTLIL